MNKSVRRFILRSVVFFAVSLSVIAFALWDGIIWPEAGGGKVNSDDRLTVDYSDAENGYIMCKGSKSDKRYKLRIAKGDDTLTYDLNTDGAYEVFPLQLGSGTYKISLYRNKSGNKYASGGEMKISVTLNDENAAFLVPSQYVNYDESSTAVAKSEELCSGLTTDREKFEAIKGWIGDNLIYDYIKSVTVQSGQLPDIEGTMESQMGICQDLAAVAACMLRVQGISTQLAIGYRNDEYHAWNYVYLDGEYELYDPTMQVNHITKEGTYTLERYY